MGFAFPVLWYLGLTTKGVANCTVLLLGFRTDSGLTRSQVSNVWLLTSLIKASLYIAPLPRVISMEREVSSGVSPTGSLCN